jgi:hypothetical protein
LSYDENIPKNIRDVVTVKTVRYEPIYKDVIGVRFAENGEVAFLSDLNPDSDGRINPLYDPPNFPEPWGRQIPVSAALSVDLLMRGTKRAVWSDD